MNRKRHQQLNDTHRGFHLPWQRILLTVGIFALALGLYVVFGAISNLNLPARRWTTSATVWIFDLLGGDASFRDTLITARNLQFLVVNDCTPVGVVLLVWAAILSTPASLTAKMSGLTLSAFSLVAINLIRMVTLIFIGVSFPQQLDTAHLLVWQPLMIVAAIVFWLVWFERVLNAAQR